MSKNNNKNKVQVDNVQGKTALIRGIEDDAKREADQIIAHAEQAKVDRITAKDRQVAQILDEAKSKAGEQAEALRRHSASLVSVDTKRRNLRLKERVIRLILEKTSVKMAALVSSKGYGAVLGDWIAEGTIGLATDKAIVNATETERKLITRDILSEAEAGVKRRTGRNVSITLGDYPPLAQQGITVTSADGKTAFNNQVHTRLARIQVEIRKLIFKELFGE